MSSIESLKEQARRHEQDEEWIKALGLYVRAIEKLDEVEQPDIGLHNRVGDIHARLGNLDDAMEQYGRAIDLYMESELPNNAIAVCKKVLRNVPGRPAIHLRIGQIRASQGFLVDARSSFLTYAEAMQKAGKIDAAYAALGEFADLAPDDTDLRLMIAGQMQQHGHVEQAVEQLQAGYRTLMLRGDEKAARDFESKIREMDPEAELPDAEALAGRPTGGFETTSLAADDPLGGFGDIQFGSGAAEGGEDEEEVGFDIRGGEDEEAVAAENTPAGFETTGLEGGAGGASP
ncbi:MAG: hypothetical protein KY453_11790, partial [Gemmatimonadetes bacterium]|nr:hypothetical protein [Gemmatimonadota bacterium]